MFKYLTYTKIFFLSLALSMFTNADYQIDYPAIRQFIYWVETDNKEALSKHVNYPLGRSKPIPSIKDADEFIARYDEVFDETLIKIIVDSDLGEDWSAPSWHGVMLLNGNVWLDHDGNIISVHYETELTKRKKELLINKQREGLHPSVKEFIRPILEWKTKSYIIRIDVMDDWEYRYSSWSIDKKLSDKPDLVIHNGEYHPQGSGGNHNYNFENGDYIYRIDVNRLGKYSYEEYPGSLDIYKSGKLIFREDVLARRDGGIYIPSDDSILNEYED